MNTDELARVRDLEVRIAQLRSRLDAAGMALAGAAIIFLLSASATIGSWPLLIAGLMAAITSALAVLR